MLFIVVIEAFFLEAVKDLSKEEIGRKLVASEAINQVLLENKHFLSLA